MKKKNRYEIDWRRHWESWKQSGLSQVAYSRKNQIPIHAFRYWITKYNQVASSEPTRALIKLPEQYKPRNEACLELEVGQKYNLRIKEGINPDLLKAVLDSLEERIC